MYVWTRAHIFKQFQDILSTSVLRKVPVSPALVYRQERFE